MPRIEIAAEKLFSLLGFPVTNTLIMTWVVMVILIGAAYAVSRRMSLVPGRLQNIIEMIFESFINLVESLVGSRRQAEQYAPLITTIFLFILLSNWLGIFPGIGSIGVVEQRHGERVLVPLFRSAASDLNVTLALGTIAVVVINATGVAVLGARTHLSKFFSFKGPIEFFVGILEFVSEFARIVSFSFRLFGNILAGEVLIMVISFLAPWGAPLPFMMLELFVGFMQALVFAMLMTVFVSIAVAHH